MAVVVRRRLGQSFVVGDRPRCEVQSGGASWIWWRGELVGDLEANISRGDWGVLVVVKLNNSCDINGWTFVVKWAR